MSNHGQRAADAIAVPPYEHVHLMSDPAEDIQVRVMMSRAAYFALLSDWVPVAFLRLHPRGDGSYELHGKGGETADVAEEKAPPDTGHVIQLPPD